MKSNTNTSNNFRLARLIIVMYIQEQIMNDIEPGLDLQIDWYYGF